MGQDLWETAQVVRRGENYGWSITEGSHPFQSHRKRGPTPIMPPTIEHPHSEARSLTGGHVYYGSKYPMLRGHYVYGDYATGIIWAAKYDKGSVTSQFPVARTSLQIAGFGIDHEGELIVVDHGSGLYGLVPTRQEQSERLSPTAQPNGIYESITENRIHSGLIPTGSILPFGQTVQSKSGSLVSPGTKRSNSKQPRAGTFLMELYW